MKLLQINSVVNVGSTGRIAEQIGHAAMNAGWDSYIAYGRNSSGSQSNLIKIGHSLDVMWHGVISRLFDAHGLGSRIATDKFIKDIEDIRPDIVHLHNIHGYYLNYEILFNYLSHTDIPIVWTLHDCWPMTGHCCHFDFVQCDFWKSGCHNCVNKREYPTTIGFDNSKSNYTRKLSQFNSVRNLTFVPVSQWLADLVSKSGLRHHKIQVINNGIDILQFNRCNLYEEEVIRRKLNLTDENILLGVTNCWSTRKGFDDFIRLSKLLPANYKIVLVGLTRQQLQLLPQNIIGIKRTESVHQLSVLYSMASAFINLTYEDTYPTTNLEAIACGTPVITYRTGGSPESVTSETGIVVDKGDLGGVLEAVNIILSHNREDYRKTCRTYAEVNFNMHSKFKEYIDLYKTIINR